MIRLQLDENLLYKNTEYCGSIFTQTSFPFKYKFSARINMEHGSSICSEICDDNYKRYVGFEENNECIRRYFSFNTRRTGCVGREPHQHHRLALQVVLGERRAAGSGELKFAGHAAKESRR